MSLDSNLEPRSVQHCATLLPLLRRRLLGPRRVMHRLRIKLVHDNVERRRKLCFDCSPALTYHLLCPDHLWSGPTL